MKRTSLCLLLLVLSFNGITQIIFEPGYFIDNRGKRTDCLIKNVDWKNNPISFLYKMTEDGQREKATIDSISEFGITGISKYFRAEVLIDRSGEEMNSLSRERNPVFKREVLFLKVLVEGEADLYTYADENLVRYFTGKDTSGIIQLVYKPYLTPESKIGINNDFRQYLWVNFPCEGIQMPDVAMIGYKKNELVGFFEKYNNCIKPGEKSPLKKVKKDLINLTVRPGVCFSSFSISNSMNSFRDASFSNRPGFYGGLEAEFILPFLKNKWSIILEPGISYLNSGKEIENGRFDVEYKSLELPAGIRHYFFLNEHTAVFLNASVNFNAALNSGIYYETGTELEIKTMVNFVTGAGIKYKSRYSLEVRYGFNRNILASYALWNSEYRSFSVILGYTLF